MPLMPRRRILSILCLCLCLTFAACAPPVSPPPPGAAIKNVNLADEQLSIEAEIWEAGGKHFIRGTLVLLQVNANQYRGAKLSAQFMKDGKKVDAATMDLRYNRNANRFEFEGVLDTKKRFDNLKFMVFYKYRPN